MTDDEDNPPISPIPGVPWGIDFGILESHDGKIWVSVQIHTHTGLIVLFGDPDFSERVANMWHTTAVKAKHHSPGPKLVVAKTQDILAVTQGQDEHP